MVSLKLIVLCVAFTTIFAKIDLDKKCIEGSNQCIDNAECNVLASDKELKCMYGTCKCKSGYWKDGNKCSKFKAREESCNNNAECDGTKHMICTGTPKKCNCATNWKWSSNKCTVDQARAFDEDCTFSDECTKDYTDGACVASKCKCKGQFTIFNKKCLKQDYNNNCKDADAGSTKCAYGVNLECKSEKCECKTDYTYDNSKKLCKHKDSKSDVKEHEVCTFAPQLNQYKYRDCTGSSLKCRRCSTDILDNNYDGFCVNLSKVTDCNGATSKFISLSVLLAGIIAYFTL